ncbi:MAG TPA: efflux RND transporter permease subunit, partial [Candidatus Krumholzibacteria bacterium]|nr:efflux RND transporter permease subunit [Candidatus Krumholzibacteria bacterium]
MKIIRFAVTHPVTVWMVTLAAVVFGLTSLGRLDMRLLPEIRYPSLTVQTDFPGTAPVDVENLVTRPLEEAVGVVAGLRKVHSISQSGLSQITLEFDWGTPMDYAALDVREKIDLVRLPREATVPVLLKYDPAQEPVLRIGLSGSAPLVQLRATADEVLKKEIEALSGVAAAQVSGGLEEEIRVAVDEDRLAALGLSIGQVNTALAQENINASGGRLRDRGAEYIVRTLSRFATLEDIERVTVGTAAGRPVRLGEVAVVERTHKERTTITRIDGRESVEIAVYKEGDANIVDTARRVQADVEALQKRLPPSMRMEVLFDQSTFIAAAVREVRDNAMLGGLLAVLVLFVFLRDLRSTFIIGLAIPVSIVATFILMLTRGVSLNVMSLGGLALGVGMLVDNSIVVLEAIHRRREENPAEPGGESAARGAAEVAGAVTASTLTTLAVFVPIVFVVTGVAGQIFRDQALTVTFALAVSLVVALTFTPMAAAFGRRGGGIRPAGEAGGEPSLTDARADRTCAAVPEAGSGWFASWSPPAREGRRLSRWLKLAGLFLVVGLPLAVGRGLKLVGGLLRRLLLLVLWPLTAVFERTFPAVQDGYARALGMALGHRVLVLLLAGAVAGGAALLWPRLGAELVPPLARGEFTLALELPEGTPLSRTDAVTAAFAHDLAELPQIAMAAGAAGVSREGGTTAERRKENCAEVHVRLAGRDAAAEAEALEAIRAVQRRYPDLGLELRRETLLAFGAPVEIDVYGYNLRDLQATADLVASRAAAVNGLRDLRVSMVPGSPEVQVTFDRDKLARLGLSLGEVSQTVQDKVRGTVASRFRDRERHVDIRVLNADDQRVTVDAVRELIVAERDGVPVTLGALATTEVVTGPAEIHRLGSRRAALVTADLAGRDLASVTRDLEAQLAGLPLPAGVTVEIGGQNDEMNASFRSLRLAVLLALFLV